MKGTMIGDIIGSSYEFCAVPVKTKRFRWFAPGSRITDDTITMIAVSAALDEGKRQRCGYTAALRRQLRYWCRKYPDAGYGQQFRQWFLSDERGPYGSYGNGAAMRVAPAAWVSDSLDEAQVLAEITAIVTHDHPEAVKGAVAAASAVYLARRGSTAEEIRAYIRKYFYPLEQTLDQIRPGYAFTCRTADSVPQAIEAFLESRDFSDAVANAVSLGGDTDTQGAIAGAAAEAYYGVPDELWNRAKAYIPAEVLQAFSDFERRYMTGRRENR